MNTNLVFEEKLAACAVEYQPAPVADWKIKRILLLADFLACWCTSIRSSALQGSSWKKQRPEPSCCLPTSICPPCALLKCRWQRGCSETGWVVFWQGSPCTSCLLLCTCTKARLKTCSSSRTLKGHKAEDHLAVWVSLILWGICSLFLIFKYLRSFSVCQLIDCGYFDFVQNLLDKLFKFRLFTLRREQTEASLDHK